LNNAHPPLFFIILFFWTKLGYSELFLRIISVLSGTALIYVGYKWVEKCFGKNPGLVMSLLLAFSTTLIALSQEVRGYSVLILFITCALYYFQMMLDKKAILPLILFSIFIYLAILVHYSASFFWLAIGIYFSYLAFRKELNRKMILVWAIFQLGAIGIYGFLYRTHLSLLSKSAIRQEAIQGWLASSFLNIHHVKLKEIFLYPLARTIEVFRYLFSLQNLALPLVIAFVIATVMLILKHRWRIGILFVLPFLANLFASILKVYPYGGTRHIVYLIIFAYAGIAYLFGKWFERRIHLILISGLILIPLWITFAQKPEQFIKPKNQQLELMRKAKEYIENYLPKDEVIFTDYQTSVMLGYYLGKEKIQPPATFQNDFLQYRYAGYQFVASEVWTFNKESFIEQFRRLPLNFAIDSTGSIWIIDAGIGWNLRNELLTFYPELPFLRQKAFGENISIFQLPVEEVLKLETPSMRVERINTALLSLSKATQNLKEIEYRTVFWPTERGWEAFRPFWVDSTITVVPLKKLYLLIVKEKKLLDDFLPALVFWILNDQEQHIQIFSFMNDRENYIAAGYAFTLRYIDPEGIVALYEINWVKGSDRIVPKEK
jgi:hypothetical protein